MSKRDRQLSRRERKQTEPATVPRPRSAPVLLAPSSAPASPAPATAQRRGPVLFFATPTHRAAVDIAFHFSMRAVGAELPKRGISWLHSHSGSSDVGSGRDALAFRFLQSQATHLVFVDDDQGFDLQTVLRLIELDKDIVAAHTAKKDIDWSVVRAAASAGLSDDDIAKCASRPMPVVPVLVNGQPRKDRGAVQVQHAGTGMMAIKRDVIACLYAAHPELTYTNNPALAPGAPCVGIFLQTIVDGTRFSEDYAFCRRAAAIGAEIWLDYSHPMLHIGRYVYRTPPLADIWADEHGAIHSTSRPSEAWTSPTETEPAQAE